MSDWPNVALGNLMVRRGGSLLPSEFPSEEFELYSISAHDRGGSDVVVGRDIGSSKQVVKPRDVMISKIVPHIRRSRVVSEMAGRRQIASGEWIVFRSNLVEPNYLRHYLVSNTFHRRFMGTVAGVGGSLLRARPSAVAQLSVPLPPIEDQRRIAAILDNADSSRALATRSLTALRLLPSELFQSRFSADVPARPLGEHLSFLTSGSRGWAKHYTETGDPFIRIQNVKNTRLDLQDVAYVTAPSDAEAKRTRVSPGDVLLSITADLGRTAIVPVGLGAAYLNQHLAILRSDTLDPHFLAHYLESANGKRQLMRRNRAAVKAGLNFDDIRSVEIPQHSLAAQQRFATDAMTLESQYRRAAKRLVLLDELAGSLRAQAFSGRL